MTINFFALKTNYDFAKQKTYNCLHIYLIFDGHKIGKSLKIQITIVTRNNNKTKNKHETMKQITKDKIFKIRM